MEAVIWSFVQVTSQECVEFGVLNEFPYSSETKRNSETPEQAQQVYTVNNNNNDNNKTN